MSKKQELLARAKAALQKARDISEPATKAGRDLTESEQEQIQAFLAEATDLKNQIDALDKPHQPSVANLLDLAELTGIGGTGPAITPGWAKEVSRRLTQKAQQFGVKAITTGGIDIPSPVSPRQEPIPPARATRILELIPSDTVSTNSYAYAQQTVRTNNAAGDHVRPAAEPGGSGGQAPQRGQLGLEFDDAAAGWAVRPGGVSRRTLAGDAFEEQATIIVGERVPPIGGGLVADQAAGHIGVDGSPPGDLSRVIVQAEQRGDHDPSLHTHPPQRRAGGIGRRRERPRPLDYLPTRATTVGV